MVFEIRFDSRWKLVKCLFGRTRGLLATDEVIKVIDTEL